tara:strand:+ start:115 stop:453 length:339 start_codon:yes stop_codon:yes gene_type:complete
MDTLNEEKLVAIEIDFNELKKNKLNESFLAMFGSTIKLILDGMFGGAHVPAYLRGTRSDVNAFATTLGREKKYLEAAKKYGLDDPRTFQNKSKLQKAAQNFEAETGLKWPFK